MSGEQASAGWRGVAENLVSLFQPAIPSAYKKRSFLEFDLPVSHDALLAEYAAIPQEAWAGTYWNKVHTSVTTLLLRGGTSGDQTDYWSRRVEDAPILKSLPSFAALVGPDGPFGQATYAFIFKMKPGGVALRHKDGAWAWKSRYRIHVPLITNPGAFLIAGDKSLHLKTGSAWTFDNQQEHGVVNGDETRVHLIFDVPFSELMARQFARARFHEGEFHADHVARIAR